MHTYCEAQAYGTVMPSWVHASRRGTSLFRVFILESRPSSAKYPVQSSNAVNGGGGYAWMPGCLECLGHGDESRCLDKAHSDSVPQIGLLCGADKALSLQSSVILLSSISIASDPSSPDPTL